VRRIRDENGRVDVVIRTARPGDGPGLAQAALDFSAYYIELDPERFKYPSGDLVGWFESELQKPTPDNTVWLIAEADGTAIGAVEAAILEPIESAEIQSQRDVGLRRAYVNYLAVQTVHRNRGVGSLLMEAVEQWAKEQGVELILTDTRIDGLSVRFYEKNGYTQQSVILRKTLV
jgi:GNAT superfamily N-acetyltransferase